MPLVFYDCPTAPSPRRARILLAEKSVPHEVVTIDLRAGEQLSEAFRAINPLCTVPALRLPDGTVLPDNAAIAAWLEAAYPDPGLFGTTPLEKAMVAHWTARAEGEFLLAIADALRNTAPAFANRALTGPVDVAQIPELAARGLARIDRFFDTLEERLDGREYLAIDCLSHADVVALVGVDFARIVRRQPGAQHVNLARWRAALSARPAFRS